MSVNNPEIKTAQPLISVEQDRLVEPRYPLLDIAELGATIPDVRSLLDAESAAAVRPDETIVDVIEYDGSLPSKPVGPLEILMRAANASLPEEIGYMGPTVASVDVLGKPEASRYERQHGRDDLIAADDVKGLYPKLLDTVAVSLAGTQAVADEQFVTGQPYGFGKRGAIILVNFTPNDPLGQKFQSRKDWKSPFYASADAPGLFVAALADLQTLEPSYLTDRRYLAIDGQEYAMGHAFDLGVQWLVDRMAENPEGLIEYRNPYKNGRGMRNQGWKDSADAMVHHDGSWVNSQGGVAPIEVQVQAVISLRKAAAVYQSTGKTDVAAAIGERADELFEFIVRHGWVETSQGGHFAMGWDRDDSGNLRRIDTKSIDMHHLLRVLDPAVPMHQAMIRQTIRTLTGSDMLTRWGSRVMSSAEPAYGDNRYHCGVWPDKSNRVAESMSAAGFPGIDRALGQLTTNLITAVGCVPEHISGANTVEPVIPRRDVYAFNRRYQELHLIEQAPPLGQTWGATSELGKQQRYTAIPAAAAAENDRQFEQEILDQIAAVR